MYSLPNGVSFLVCTYNSSTRIAETLECLARQVVAATIAWEVILVDNACTDGTTPIAQLCWQQAGTPAPLHTLVEPRPGKNFALELAFSQAHYCYACIVDDDNRLAPDYLQVGYDLLESNAAIGILGGQTIGTFETNPPDWFPAFQNYYAVGKQIVFEDGQVQPMRDGKVWRNVLWGAGMFVRTAIWYQLQQLSFKSLFVGRQGTKNLTAGEDHELCYAAQMLGYEIWYSSKLQLQHYMTVSRLTVDYRNRLFYSVVWQELRMKAYQDALWGDSRKDYSSSTTLAKDFLFMSRGFVCNIISIEYFKALFKKDTFYLMAVNYQLLALYNFICDFKNIKLYHRAVTDFKNRINVAQ